MFPYGNIVQPMKITARQVGEQIKAARKSLGVTQKDLAMTSGTGLRFIIELEKGKPTCQLGKALTVLNTLGITVKMSLPAEGSGKQEKDPGYGAHA